jgi:putative aminopeptidase FrvX
MPQACEICSLVKSITDDGFLHTWPCYQDTRGHPPRWVLSLNQPALVMTNDQHIAWYFATASGHVVANRDQSAKWSWNGWCIDIGACNRAEAEALGAGPAATSSAIA